MAISHTIEEVIHDAELDDSYVLLTAKEKDVKKQLQSIEEHYITKKMCYYDKCESTAKQLLMTILTDSELSEIHSARYRVKTIDSFRLKGPSYT